MKNEQLEQIALEARKSFVRMSLLSGSGHITSSASCLELLVSLYFGKSKMRYNASNPSWNKRDYLILSKGHAAMGLYCMLAEAGFISNKELGTFCQRGTRLGGHPSLKIPGVETASGSLGHGLPFGVGAALGMKLKKSDNCVYVITGDGELQEGSNWEAALSIIQFDLKNLIWVIDKNNLQLSGNTDDIMCLGNLPERLTAIGFDLSEINGHNYEEIAGALSKQSNKPRVIIANTVKGYGYPSIENRTDWHGRKPNKEELEVILSDLGTTAEEIGL